MGVLATEVEDEHGPLIFQRPALDRNLGDVRLAVGPEAGHQRLIPTPCSFWSFLPSVCNAGANMISAFWNSWIVS